MIKYSIEERLNECRARMERAIDLKEYSYFKARANTLISAYFSHPQLHKPL